MVDERGPNLFIIGAPKCGTTSLHFYLDQHPEISMSSFKEPNVFSDPRWHPRLESHDGLFDGDCPIRGESSTSYSRHPAEGDAAAAIHRQVPHAKLIYLVGDPVERLVSDYAQARAVGAERRPIDEALEDYEDPANWYVCASRYSMQIENYLKHFDPGALLVIEQSELRDQRQATLRRVFEFLGVDPDFWSGSFKPELATRDDHLRFGSLEWRLRESPLGRGYRRLPVRLRLPISRTLRRLGARRDPRPTLDPELRTALEGLLESELERARQVSTAA